LKKYHNWFNQLFASVILTFGLGLLEIVIIFLLDAYQIDLTTQRSVMETYSVSIQLVLPFIFSR